MSGFVIFLAAGTAVASIPARQRYDESTAKLAAHLSASAYCPKDTLSSWSCTWCQSSYPTGLDVQVVDDVPTDTQAFVAHDDILGIIVAFRGTRSLDNWIHNLNFAKTTAYPLCDGCLVHQGFFAAWTSVQVAVTDAVKSLLRRHGWSTPLFITGHSLGAALAALCAAHLSYHELLTVTNVFTFGQPRVGNEAFKSFYNQGTHVSWRVTHFKDPVPHLPLTLMGFHHISTEVWYSDQHSSNFSLCDASGEDPSCSDSVSSPGDALHVQDHLRYLNISISDCEPTGTHPIRPSKPEDFSSDSTASSQAPRPATPQDSPVSWLGAHYHSIGLGLLGSLMCAAMLLVAVVRRKGQHNAVVDAEVPLMQPLAAGESGS